jgi:hypothetical protein
MAEGSDADYAACFIKLARQSRWIVGNFRVIESPA